LQLWKALQQLSSLFSPSIALSDVWTRDPWLRLILCRYPDCKRNHQNKHRQNSMFELEYMEQFVLVSSKQQGLDEAKKRNWWACRKCLAAKLKGFKP
jgi:hypothetical protein